jgi:protein ImuB
MRRIVSVWLPLWPIERMARAAPAAVPHDAPLALVEAGSHGISITAVNVRAAADGARIGQALADARAALPTLLSRPAEPRRDRAALLKLARWCGRYGPNRNADGEDGLWIDVTGVAHLSGGEERLLGDLCARLSGFGLTVRAGLADTLGAAHALARFASSPALVLAGETEPRLAALPVEALRLAPETVVLLKRLGLRRIGDLYGLPRAALQRRFRSSKGAEAVLRPSRPGAGGETGAAPAAGRAAGAVRAALLARSARLGRRPRSRDGAADAGAVRGARCARLGRTPHLPVALSRRRHGRRGACRLELPLLDP